MGAVQTMGAGQVAADGDDAGYPREDGGGSPDEVPSGDFLQKPFERAAFLERLRTLLAEVEHR